MTALLDTFGIRPSRGVRVRPPTMPEHVPTPATAPVTGTTGAPPVPVPMPLVLPGQIDPALTLAMRDARDRQARRAAADRRAATRDRATATRRTRVPALTRRQWRTDRKANTP